MLLRRVDGLLFCDNQGGGVTYFALSVEFPKKMVRREVEKSQISFFRQRFQFGMMVAPR